MPHLEKLGSHVMVMNYRQACVSPEAPSFLRTPPACTRTSAVGVFNVEPTDVGVILMQVISVQGTLGYNIKGP